MSARVVRTLVALEARRAAALLVEGLAALAGLWLLAWLLRGASATLARGLPDFTILVVVPLFATALGGDALAGEHAQGTWSFLRARAVRVRTIVGVKIGVRLAALLVMALVAAIVVGASTGGAPAALPLFRVGLDVGLRLAALMSLTGFACAFVVGARLHDPVTATGGGVILATTLILLLLAPGVVAHGAWTWLLGGAP